MSVEQTLKERGGRYGSFLGNAHVAQDLKRVVRLHLAARDKKLADDQIEAIEMILHKIARIINGDPSYADNWHDIAGYAKLVEDQLGRMNKQSFDAAVSIAATQAKLNVQGA